MPSNPPGGGGPPSNMQPPNTPGNPGSVPPTQQAGGNGPQPGSGTGGGNEQHFMQQQSQIFVFSTSMANKAAELVRQGQYQSIRDFHMDQPGTKQFLQVMGRRVGHIPHLYDIGKFITISNCKELSAMFLQNVRKKMLGTMTVLVGRVQYRECSSYGGSILKSCIENCI